MVMCGASFRIYAADADSPGSQHDAKVFKDSPLFKALMEGYCPIPNGVILGDSAYPVSLHTIQFQCYSL